MSSGGCLLGMKQLVSVELASKAELIRLARVHSLISLASVTPLTRVPSASTVTKREAGRKVAAADHVSLPPLWEAGLLALPSA